MGAENEDVKEGMTSNPLMEKNDQNVDAVNQEGKEGKYQVL